MKRILIVDDEVQILKSLIRMFMNTEYVIHSTENGETALKILESNEIDLIISDIRMPSMDGYQLLRKVKDQYPRVLRVVLSGYSDEKLVLKALQQNIAKFYMFKPWNNEKLLKLVEQIFDTEDLLKDNDLLILINNFEELPTIKANYQKVISLIESDTDISQISREIEKDQSISTMVLHIANSAFYGVKTGSVKKAVTYLGLTNIRNLILSTSIIDAMGMEGITGDYIDRLWSHAFLTNKLLFHLYNRVMGKGLPDAANASGLLHNIGTVFMLKCFSKTYVALRKKAERKQLDLPEMEKTQFKVTHMETGGYLLKWWDLPFPIVEAALYHHQPFDDRIINKELIWAVHLAQKYAWDLLKSPALSSFYPEVFEALGFTQAEFEQKLKTLDLE